jgi:hypothetical protein
MFPAPRSARRALWLGLGLWACLPASGCARLHPFLPERAIESPAEDPSSAGLGTTPNTSTNDALVVKNNAPALAPSPALAPAPKTWLSRAGSDLHAEITHLTARFSFRRPLAPLAVANATPESKAANPSTSRDSAQPVRIALQAPTSLAPRGQNRPAAPAPAGSRAPAAGTSPPAAQPPKDPAQTQADNASKAMESVVASTRTRLESLGNYQLKLTRQERIGTALQAPEDVVLSVRRQPQAIRLEWKEGAHKGREVLYNADRDGGVMQVNMADSLVPMPRLSMRPDSPMALAQSRHPITEAGFDTIVARLERAQQRTQAGDKAAGPLSYSGLETIPECTHPCHKLLQTNPTGESWLVYVDSQTKLPALVQARAANGDLLERYVFRDVQSDITELAADTAFDPDKRWGQSPSLIRRLARANAPNSPADISQTH